MRNSCFPRLYMIQLAKVYIQRRSANLNSSISDTAIYLTFFIFKQLKATLIYDLVQIFFQCIFCYFFYNLYTVYQHKYFAFMICWSSYEHLLAHCKTKIPSVKCTCVFQQLGLYKLLLCHPVRNDGNSHFQNL